MEILQMASAGVAILSDETDSWPRHRRPADRVEVTALRRPDRAMLVITHHQRLLDYIKPDRVPCAGCRLYRPAA
jgi:Fe-S cluster assembly ATP-binding protein